MTRFAPHRPRRVPARATALLALGLWSLAGAVLPALRAQPYVYDHPEALTLGIHHPSPRLCGRAEPSQRDLRVIRLAFGIDDAPGERLSPPWFLERLPAQDDGRRVALRPEALWDLPAAWLNGNAPLDGWRDTLSRELGAALEPDANRALAWSVDPPGPDPFFWSRLRGSRMLPAVAGWRAAALEGSCLHWPAGVWLEPAEAPLRYRLVGSRPEHRRPFALQGYRRAEGLWGDFRRGRLGAALIEGPELAVLTRDLPDDTVWGRVVGGQQIVLRLAPRLREGIGAAGVAALSRAVPREPMARGFAGGGLMPARGFFTAVGAPPGERDGVLSENLREARRAWLAGERDVGRPTLAVLEHPALVALAQRIVAQWQRTLNLSVTVDPLPMGGFARDRRRWAHELYLTVVDLDDGSLQDLWLEALEDQPWSPDPETGAPTREQVEVWEAEFRERLPYLPVLQNAHWYAARGDGATGRIRTLCPACDVPVRAPEVPRTAPQGVQPIIPREG